MDANGRTDDGREQLIWAYMIGKAQAMKEIKEQGGDPTVLNLTREELNAMFFTVAGMHIIDGMHVKDPKEYVGWGLVRHWIEQLLNMVPYFQGSGPVNTGDPKAP